MSSYEMRRRDLLALSVAAGLAIFDPKASSAQERALGPNARDAGPAHQIRMDAISRALDGKRLDTRDGLLKILDALVQSGLIPKEEAEVVARLIDAIYSSSSIEAMLERIDKIYRDVAGKASDLVVAIASVARASVEFVRKLPQKVDPKRAAVIVASDVSGALNGAATGAALGGRFLVVFCAIVGGVSGSANTAFGTPP